jgi:response regulator of citrate/malate metabolism
MERERDESGQYTEQVTLDSIREVFSRAEVPVLTASEVADELECSRPSAYNKLEDLVEQGELHKKKVGARAVVYIRLNELDHPG